ADGQGALEARQARAVDLEPRWADPDRDGRRAPAERGAAVAGRLHGVHQREPRGPQPAAGADARRWALALLRDRGRAGTPAVAQEARGRSAARARSSPAPDGVRDLQ